MLTYLLTFPICMYNKIFKDKKKIMSCEPWWGMPTEHLMQESFEFKNNMCNIGRLLHSKTK